MAAVIDDALREQLLDRREKLQAAVAAKPMMEYAHLIAEVDAALARMNMGVYGLCDVCHDPVETERLLADPVTRFCLDHLSAQQQRALEEDLKLAVNIQRGLLPQPNLDSGAWETCYIYEPAGLVSGDYCDLIKENGDLYFILGDVAGKGVAAALLMSNLQAMFHTLIGLRLPLDELMARASRMFCANTWSNHFATLICGRACAGGEVEICNAGHLPPILIERDGKTRLDGAGLPLGMFCDEHFTVTKLRLSPGDTLLLYTDGVTEATDASQAEYGLERLLESIAFSQTNKLVELVNECLFGVTTFRGKRTGSDDMTIMALRFAG